MAIYKVWIQIEKDDGDGTEPSNLELPDCLGEFLDEEAARTFVLGALLTARNNPGQSDQTPAWYRKATGGRV